MPLLFYGGSGLIAVKSIAKSKGYNLLGVKFFYKLTSYKDRMVKAALIAL